MNFEFNFLIETFFFIFYNYIFIVNNNWVLNMKNVFLKTVVINLIFTLCIFGADQQQVNVPSSAHTTTLAELETIAIKPYFTK